MVYIRYRGRENIEDSRVVVRRGDRAMYTITNTKTGETETFSEEEMHGMYEAVYNASVKTTAMNDVDLHRHEYKKKLLSKLWKKLVTSVL